MASTKKHNQTRKSKPQTRTKTKKRSGTSLNGSSKAVAKKKSSTLKKMKLLPQTSLKGTKPRSKAPKVVNEPQKPRKKILFYLAVTLLTVGALAGFTVLGYFVATWRFNQIPVVPTEIAHPATQMLPYVTHNEHYAPIKVTIGDKISEDILPQVLEDGIWSVPATAAAHLITSAYPYEPNNIIVYGHNTWAVFAKLKNVQQTDIIKLTLANGSEREYEITEIIEVTPDKIEYLKPTQAEILTIYTCSGWMDSKRLIIRAVPKTSSMTL